MYWLTLLVAGLAVALEVCILALLLLRKLQHRFPVFTWYIVCKIAVSLGRAVFLRNYRVYYYVYWFTEPIDVLLSIAAVYESSVKVYGAFFQIWRVRLVFLGAILAALGYSIWAAEHNRPAHFTGWNAAIIQLMLVVQYVIMGVVALFFLLRHLAGVRWRSYEFRFVFGFGVYATAIALAMIFRSEFGTKYAFLSERGPSVAYFVALLVWLSAVLGKEPDSGLLPAGPPPSPELLEALRTQLRTVKKLLRPKDS
jgi:hypothetical protein